MLRGIIRTSLSFRFLMIIVAGIITFFAINQLREMPVDVLPEFSPPFVEIQTEALGLSAEEVEQMLTVPMEQDLLAGVAWLDVIRSESVPGLSSVLVYFEPGTDLYRARQMVAERLAQSAVGLPHVSKPPTMIQPLSSTSRFMIVGLSSKKLSLIEMSVLARWTIAPRLMGVPGVANVAIWGQRERQLQVLVNPERLRAQGVSIGQVIETTGNALWVSSLSFLEASSPGTGGFIDTPNQRLGVWHLLPISSPDDLAKVPIEGSSSLLVKDVASVVEDHQLLIGDGVINNDSNLLLVIEKLPGINTLEVTQGIETALDVLRPGFKEMDFNATLFRPATFIEMAFANLTRTLIIAAILVLVVLGAFLYGWRTALISLVAILLALVAALGVLYLRGATLNSMVLAGLIVALGIIIDDAVIDIAHLMRRLRQNRQAGNPETVESAILNALGESRGFIFFGLLITLLAVMPVFVLDGITGSLVKPLVVSYAIALVASTVVALLVTPALCILLISNSISEEPESPLVIWLKRVSDQALEKIIHKTPLVYVAVIALIAISLISITFIRANQLLPTFKEPYLMINLDGAPATSRTEMDRIVIRISNELKSISGVQNVGAHVGRAIFGDQIVGINSAELWVNIDPKADYDTTVATIRLAMSGYPGVRYSVSTYLTEIISETQTKPENSITLRVFGDDPDILQAQAEKLQQSVAGVKGIVGSQILLPVTEPTVEIEVDLASAQHYGIKPGEVRRIAATLISGLPVGSLFEEQKVFDVVVWSVPELRDSLTDILDMPIEINNGSYIYLKDVADIRIVDSPTIIRHEGVSAYLDLKFSIQGRNALAVENEIDAVIKSFIFPLEYHAEVLSDFARQQSVLQSILTAVIIALIGMFLLIHAASGNWRLTAAIFLSLPAALSGCILAAFASGETLSYVSFFGLLTIVGIATRNSIVLIKSIDNIKQHSEEAPSIKQIQQGMREQVASIIMTAFTTGAALLPFALFGNIPGLEIARPIAFITIGGLVTSTLFNLLVIPVLYLNFGASREADLRFQTASSSNVPVPGDD
jgi:Cu/Ag efflux pump CusA